MSDELKKPIADTDLQLITDVMMELRHCCWLSKNFSPNQLKRLNVIMITGLAYEANFGRLKSLEEPE